MRDMIELQYFMQRFVIGRYYFNSLFKEEANRLFIEDLLKQPYIDERNFSYAIGNINGETEEGYELTSGTFGRVRKGSLADVYDKENKQFISQTMPDTADVTLRFIINHQTHLIFVEYDNRIQPEYFANKFAKIYEHNTSYGELVIDFIFIERDVYETIQKWDRVDTVIFKKLRPSNPSSLDDFAEIEKLLKETNSLNTKIEFHAPSRNGAEDSPTDEVSDGGLDYESTLIKQGLALSAHGYGEAKITGKEDGKEATVESKKFFKKLEVDFYEDGALKRIVETIEEINKDEKED